MLLPPTSDSLQQHIKRANYQAYIWRKALVARQGLPSPDGHGWRVEDNALCPVLMTKLPAPASILELTNCQCLSQCAHRTAPVATMDWPAPRHVSVWLTGSAVIPIRGACITRTIKTPMIQTIRNNKGKVGRPKISDFIQSI